MGLAKLPTEHQEQATVIAWFDSANPEYKGELFAIPNGAWLAGSPTQRYQQISKLKREGLRDGIPDLFLPVPNKTHHGLFIEMKRQKGGVVSPQQKRRINKVRRRGYAAHVCAGAEAAIQVISEYLKTACPEIECEVL